MFRSVFSKIFFTYLSILILVMFVLSLTISSLAKDYVFDEKKKLLDNVAEKANSAANSYLYGDITQDGLTDTVNAMGYIADAKIYIIKGDITSNIDLGNELTGQYLKDALSKALAGQSVFLKRQYSADFDAQMLFAAYPWRDSSGIKGAILLFSPEEEVSAIVGNIELVIWLTAIGFVFIGGLIIYFFTRKIVKPIKAIDNASASMAVGEQVEDIKISSRDELGSLARSFNSMKRKISENERLRQDLIANISHDLRTPVTNINGFLSGMADGIIKPGDYPKYLAILRKETQRLKNLTGEIIEIAKIQSGSIELNKERFALKDAIDGAAAANELTAGKKNVKLIHNVPEKIFVFADFKKIVQVLYNLIGNAIKYSYLDGTVTISASQQEEAVHVCVEDSGMGIAQADLPYIFERYYRTESNKTPGFGLGLSIAQTYTEAHGGNITVQSSPDKGTKACFTIPND